MGHLPPARAGRLVPAAALLAFSTLQPSPSWSQHSSGSHDSGGEEAIAPPEAQGSIEEEIQVTATREPRQRFDVPAPISVIGENVLEQTMATKPGDLFDTLPGVETEGSGPFLARPVLRGVAGNRVLVLVDGDRLNNAREAINFGGVEPSLVDVGQIASIEILRGPASVLYGTDAIGGVVNIVTRSIPSPVEGWDHRLRLAPRYSSADEQESGQLAGSSASPRARVFLGASERTADAYESPAGEVPGSGAEASTQYAKLAYDWAPGRSSVLDLQRFRGEDVGVPGSGGVFTGLFPFTRRDKVAASFEASGLNGIFDHLEARAYRQDQEESFATLLDLPPVPAGPFLLSIDSETERVGDIETLGLDLHATTSLGDRHLLTYGISGFRDDVLETRSETTLLSFTPRFPGVPPRLVTEQDHSPTTPEGFFRGAGVFLQDEIRFERLTLVPGIRWDDFDLETDALVRPEGVLPAEDRSEDAVSASLAALYRLGAHWSLAASAGRAFRTPNLIERYFFGPGSQGGLTVPNPDLDNETSLNFDLGLRLRTRRARMAVTVFRNEIEDFITFVPGTFQGSPTLGGLPVTMVSNVGEVRIQGVEAEVDHLTELRDSRLRLFGVASHQEGDNLSGDEVLFVAPLKLVAGVDWSSPSGRFSASAMGRFSDGQDRVPAGFAETESFTVLSVYAGVELGGRGTPDLTLRGGIENLTDELYTRPYGAVPEPGRSYLVSLSLGLGSSR